ncbi:amidase [Burkholderia cepacia]|uniref:amidase n=1 Tax=Burkholderia cepacia TaxID=292 RepID=UPI0007593651|nr:amidase [Burkholderia cepacia]KVS34281.1 amidase [Burkholderia cepacia]MCA8119082.1 amidase [Burkholderia cepacia]
MKDIRSLFLSHDGIGLAELVRSKDLTAVELLDAAIANIEAVNPALNAVAERLYDTARDALMSLSGHESVLAGVPTLVKDLFMPVRGAQMSCGSRLFKGYRPDFDGELVARMRRGGIGILGTTTSPEFGTSYCTSSALFGQTHNPWRANVTAGGSSGGAAALVAARAVPFAHGNDGGGSLRVPASCCGVFGLKPTRGRTPMGPTVGEGWAGMGVNHAITRSVRDSAALLDLTAGRDVGAPYDAPAPIGNFLDATRRAPGSLRIGVIDNAGPWQIDAACHDALAHTMTLCNELGHRIERVANPVATELFFDRVFTIIGAQTQALLDSVGRQRGRAVDRDEIEPRTRVIVREKGGVSGAEYAAAVDWIHALGRTLGQLTQHYDVLLMPTLARVPVAPAALRVDDDALPLTALIERSHSFSPFTAWFNASGQPAMSVPLWWDANGLPIGSQFAAACGAEEMLFSLAAQLEQASPWSEQIPPTNALSNLDTTK